MANRFGLLLREWRARRNTSQLDLALRANASQRHVSFIESGRAQPSRAMVIKVAEALDIPLRSRNEILCAAGYAPIYPERPLDEKEMQIANRALERILAHHEPFPAMVLDGAWNILLRNSISARIIGHCVDENAMRRLSPDGKLNFMRLMFAPDGMRPHILSWKHTSGILITRLRREASARPGSASEVLLREFLEAGPPLVVDADVPDELLEPVIPLELKIEGSPLRLFNTIATFGAPQDITLQEMRIEMSFPADDATEVFLRQWASSTTKTRQSPTLGAKL